MPALSAAQIKNALPALPNWHYEADSLQAEYQFVDFKAAFAFMAQVALMAEKADHHPTWTNTYNTVTIVLKTHDADDKVTQKDINLAQEIVKILENK